MTAGTLYCRRMRVGARRGSRRDVSHLFNRSSAEDRRVRHRRQRGIRTLFFRRQFHLDCFAMKDPQSDALFEATALQSSFIGTRDTARQSAKDLPAATFFER